MDRRTVVAALACVAALALSARAQSVLYVHGDLATGANTGASWADAFRGPEALQLALDAAEPIVGGGGQMVHLWVVRGTYAPSKRTNPSDARSATFALMSGVHVYGGFAGGETSLEQRDIGVNVTTLTGVLSSSVRSEHVVTTSGVDSTCILDGVTVRDGVSTPPPERACRGAGIFNIGGSPVVRACTITNNNATFGTGAASGAGVYTEGGTPLFEDCRFTNNHAAHGGALYGEATLVRCHFEGNVATWNPGGFGGAVYGDCVIQHCTFRSNSATFGGGAVWGGGLIEDSTFELNRVHPSGVGSALERGPFTVRRSVFRNNEASLNHATVALFQASSFTDCTFTGNQGGAIGPSYSPADPVVLDRCVFNEHLWGSNDLLTFKGVATNCLFAGNNGGVHASDSQLVNCTFLGNTSSVGALRGRGNAVTNCVFWGNQTWNSTGQSAQVGSEPGEITLNHSLVQGLDGSLGGTGNFDRDPRLDPDGRILPNSPCIDAGDSTALPAGITADLFGNPRIHDDPGMPNAGPGGPVDIGAAEFQGASCYANCDGSTEPPVLGLADFTCFLAAYTAGAPSANCDGSTAPPRLNVQDFSCFLQHFAAGCP